CLRAHLRDLRFDDAVVVNEDARDGDLLTTAGKRLPGLGDVDAFVGRLPESDKLAVDAATASRQNGAAARKAEELADARDQTAAVPANHTAHQRFKTFVHQHGGKLLEQIGDGLLDA